MNKLCEFQHLIRLESIHTLWFKEMYLKTSSGKCRLFCLGLDVFTELSCVTPPSRVSLHRQVCHHCLPRRLSLWQPPAGSGVTPLAGVLTYWHFGLGAPNCNECPNMLLSTCSCVHELLPLLYVIDCHVMWLCILNEIFVWTQVDNKLLLLLLWKFITRQLVRFLGSE